MSQTKDPVTDVESRKQRAEKVNVEDIREIDGSTFDLPDDQTVYEVDLINDEGERRDNVVIIPGILFENTKDVQYRHEDGVIGKYTYALAMESDDAREELKQGIKKKRQETQDEIKTLREKDARLLNAMVTLNSL